MTKAFTEIKEIPTTSEKPSLLDLFRNRSYMLVFGGQLTNFIAGTIVGMTFSYLVYATTENASLMALMNIIAILPSVVIITFAGVIVDRYDQRKILLISMVFRTIVFLGFLFCFIFRNLLIKETPQTNDYTHFIWIMYLLLFISNIGGTFQSLAVSAYSKFIIEKKNLLVANSFNQTIVQISSVIAPIAAGALITFSYLYSFIIGVIIISLSSLIVLLLLFFGKQPPKVENVKQKNIRAEIKRTIDDLKVGYVATRTEPKILFSLVIYTAFNFCVASVNGTYTVVTQGEIGMNPTWLGALQAVMASIAIITTLVIMKIGKISRKLILVLLVVLLEAIGLLFFAFNRNPWLLICLNTIPFGFVNGAANIPTQTLRQETYPHEKQGRVFSIAVLFTSIGNLLGNVLVMSIANYVKSTYILLVGGLLCLFLGIVGLIVFIKNSKLHSSDYIEQQKEEIKSDYDPVSVVVQEKKESPIIPLTTQTSDRIPSLE